MKTLYEICDSISKVVDGLDRGAIDFSYDNLSAAMKVGHPADILGGMYFEMNEELFLDHDAKIERTRVETLLKDLKRFRRSFKVKELAPVIKALDAYLQETA